MHSTMSGEIRGRTAIRTDGSTLAYRWAEGAPCMRRRVPAKCFTMRAEVPGTLALDPDRHLVEIIHRPDDLVLHIIAPYKIVPGGKFMVGNIEFV